MPLPAQWSVGGPCGLNSRCANAFLPRTPYFVRASGISGACFTAIRERQFPAFQNSISGFDPRQNSSLRPRRPTGHSLAKPAMFASVTGPWESTLFLRHIHCRGHASVHGVGARPPPYGVRRGKGRSNLRDAGWPGFSPSPSCKHCGLTHSIVPAGTPLREGGVYPARKLSRASPFAPQRAANSFFVRLNGVSPSRPKVWKAPRAVAVNTGRRPPP